LEAKKKGSRILTVDEMISKLLEVKEEYGGGSAIAIKDPDTGWHMKISGFKESNNVKNRLLICAAGYGDDDILKV